ncbi:hypothetical protein HPB48_006492 [Haemaphysalis longicornis]|uniref:Uncharacterized protein n=1 Tax=Haemaphysalis longicornis TaxID=44386 RepID=A0A9J6FSH0_HAELO|nr:hypothetical protein HPB48_006492 [Haemaphysalis longicornis]
MLLQDAQLGLTLYPDPTYATRLGNSVMRGTTPDLTFPQNATEATWTNSYKNLGSDHYIVETEIVAGHPRIQRGRKLRITDWDTFRLLRSAVPDPTSNPIKDIKEWVTKLQQLTNLID